ncbi:MAG: TetR/AcrR family transcriptional regulator [Candidatus Binatia bacterium]|nr:TetR/AcrR family transcriptional regulator [Candidatus Binatia bacterium]
MPNKTIPKPKTPRAERTRAAIRDAANELFLRDGVENTTVDAIVGAAGISKGTFYVHFPRKEDLLLEYGMRRLSRIRDMLPDLVHRKTFREAMNEILDEVVRGKEWGRELTGRAILEMGTSAEKLPVASLPNLILPLVELGQARGQIRTDIPTDALAHFILRSILGALRDWGLGADTLDRETALDYALTLIFDAIQPQREA